MLTAVRRAEAFAICVECDHRPDALPHVAGPEPANDNGVVIAPDAVTDEALDRLAVELGRHLAEREFHRQE